MADYRANNRLLLTNFRKQHGNKRSTADVFYRRPKKRLIYLPVQKSPEDDSFWENDSSHNRGRQKQVEFDIDDSYSRSRSCDSMNQDLSSDYMRLSSIQSQMSPFSSQSNLYNTDDENHRDRGRKTTRQRKSIIKSKTNPSRFNTRLRNFRSNDELDRSGGYSPIDRDSCVEYSTIPKETNYVYETPNRNRQQTSDIGHWGQKQGSQTLDTYSLNTTGQKRNLQLPDLYSYDYTAGKSARFQRNRASSSPPPSLSSTSSMTYSRIAPVGRFARQKFHVSREEEEVSAAEAILNIEHVIESVRMDLCDLRRVEIEIEIEEERLCRSEKRHQDQQQQQRRGKGSGWVRRIERVTRLITLDLYSSGYSGRVDAVIQREMGRTSRNQAGSRNGFAVSVGNFLLQGSSAVEVFNLLMEAVDGDNRAQTQGAEFSRQNSNRSSVSRTQFMPRYLMAAVPTEDEAIFRHCDADILYF